MSSDREIALRGPKQRALFAALKAKPEVPIDELFDIVRGPPANGASNRDRQQWLGAYFRVLKRQLEPHGLTVLPGDRKQTYRLAVL